jgi:hypothetical protein
VSGWNFRAVVKLCSRQEDGGGVADPANRVAARRSSAGHAFPESRKQRKRKVWQIEKRPGILGDAGLIGYKLFFCN